MPIENSYNFVAISDELSSSGVIGAGRLKGLAAEGYELVINLLPDDNEHAVANERELLEAQGIEYVYIPVDFAAPTVKDFEAFTAAMNASGSKKTHIHCAANYRASGFYAAYAINAGWWTWEEAGEFITSIWTPNEHPGWTELLDEVTRRE